MMAFRREQVALGVGMVMRAGGVERRSGDANGWRGAPLWRAPQEDRRRVACATKRKQPGEPGCSNHEERPSLFLQTGGRGAALGGRVPGLGGRVGLVQVLARLDRAALLILLVLALLVLVAVARLDLGRLARLDLVARLCVRRVLVALVLLNLVAHVKVLLEC